MWSSKVSLTLMIALRQGEPNQVKSSQNKLDPTYAAEVVVECVYMYIHVYIYLFSLYICIYVFLV